MAEIRLSIFRDAMQVSSKRISTLNDEDLNALMSELLSAHSYRCGADICEIRVNAEGKAKDDGCDGWSPKPMVGDPWFGDSQTCWQFKAGIAGTPAKLKGEVLKSIPRDTLLNNGRFVIVASGSSNGKKGEADRLRILQHEAQAANIPTSAIDVLGSERLSNWCNQHPAVASRWAGRPETLWRLDDWLKSDEHQSPWHSTPVLQREIDNRRNDLDFTNGTVHHLHIQGPPGVGKTRFALELCRNARWRYAVIYVRQATDYRLPELIDSATADAGVVLLVVADEAQAEQLRPLRDALTRGQGRIRLITIGHSKTPDPIRIPALSVTPLERESMAEVVRGWYSGMPPEHVDFIVRFADGYVRLAKLAADAVMRDPFLNIRGLLDSDHIREFLDGMLGKGNRQALYVVAVLSHIGWSDEKQSEGKAVAQQLGLGWNQVRTDVEGFHRQYGIAPLSGRYRYISPTPLGIHLAVEAWTAFPDLLKSLPDVLPTEGSKDAYYERLKTIASNPHARKFAQIELCSFFRVNDFMDVRSVRRWSSLAAADPTLAARNVSRALYTASFEEREQIADEARREIVSNLVRLAWKRSTFRDAIKSLALLAEAENETWANNASTEFVERFQVFLGGTAMPYPDRLKVLDELLTTARPRLVKVAVKALARVGDSDASRMWSEPISDELPEREWQPTNGQEHLECVVQALARLRNIATGAPPDLQADFVTAAENLASLLRAPAVRGHVTEFFDAIRDAYPMAREALRRIIADILYREKMYWKELPAEDVAVIEEMHRRFEALSLHARLLQHVGQPTWEEDGQFDLTPLAAELVADQTALAAEWPWLTSGEAADAWRLGNALALVDAKGELDNMLPNLEGRGRDLRVLTAYLTTRRELNGDDWFDDWIHAQLRHSPNDTRLLFEASWRCGPTIKTAHLIATTLREHDVDASIVDQLRFGRWGENLPDDTLAEVLSALTERGHQSTAAVILNHKLVAGPNESNRWDELAIALISSRHLIRGKQMASHYWKELADRFVSRKARLIAAAIFREQADREAAAWFCAFGPAGQVLHDCVKQDPVGVWEELKPYLSDPTEVYRFSIGFPEGLVEKMPDECVKQWVSEDPAIRASALVDFVSKDLSCDDTLGPWLLGVYGDDEQVSDHFFSAYVAGSWTGPSSLHWDQLANHLESVAEGTSLLKLRQWAENAARSLHLMADNDRQREEEDELRRR